MKRGFLYVFVITIPLVLYAASWQSARYASLEKDVRFLNTVQEEWVEANKLLLTEIAVLSSPERIEKIAEADLGLSKKKPEEVLQIRIEPGRQALLP
jgi:cell division protein FtsL